MPGLAGSGRFGGASWKVANLKRGVGLGTVRLRLTLIDTLEAGQHRHSEKVLWKVMSGAAVKAGARR